MNSRSTAKSSGLCLAVVALAIALAPNTARLAAATDKAAMQSQMVTTKIPLEVMQRDLTALRAHHSELNVLDRKKVQNYSLKSTRGLTKLHAVVQEGNRVTPGFVTSLDASQGALRQLAAKKSLNAHDVERLSLLSRDIEVKEMHVMHFTSGPAPDVEVVVTTKRGVVEVKGLQVLYLPAAEEDKSHALAFGQFSSPTKTSLTPGIYTMWCRNTAVDPAINGPETELTVSWKKNNDPFDLPAPVEPPTPPAATEPNKP